jgi:hypothetical protein
MRAFSSIHFAHFCRLTDPRGGTEGLAVKRWFAHICITTYLGALLFGFVTHAFDIYSGFHPAMYFLVWDMFCGWAGYEGRMQVIGEGESGKFYELAPAPWGEFHPYGYIPRQHYDPDCKQGERLGHMALKHTTHEPMVRLFVVQEEYPKKFNLPEAQYEAYYGKPKQFHKYCHTRFVLTPNGEVLQSQPTFFVYQYEMGLRDNPRLMSDARRSRPFIPAGLMNESRGASSSTPFYEAFPGHSVRPPLAQ